jgi:hypothetical protein
LEYDGSDLRRMPLKTRKATPQLRVFDAIPPARAIHRNDLCKAIGWSPTSSNIRDRLGELRRLGLIVQRPDGHVARADWVPETGCSQLAATTMPQLIQYDRS